jgi:hypothetical protein
MSDLTDWLQQKIVSEIIEGRFDAAAQLTDARNELERLDAKANFFQHESECCGGCSECGRLFKTWRTFEKRKAGQ